MSERTEGDVDVTRFSTEKRVTAEEEALTARILGAAIAVHRILGPGFVESVYHRALERELGTAGLSFRTEYEVVIWYDGIKAGEHRLDLLVADQVIVELKTVSQFSSAHYAQVRSYLRACQLRVGLLLNFGDAVLRVRRILNTTALLPQNLRPFRPSE